MNREDALPLRAARFSVARLLAIVRKEVRQLSRDRLTGGMIVGLPLVQILLFGYAINTDVRYLDAAVADLSGTQLSREFTARLGQTQVLNFIDRADSVEQLESRLRDGSITVGVYLPPDFDRRLARGERSAVHLLVDGSDPTIVRIANQLRSMPVGFGDAAQRVQSDPGPIEVRPYYNPERRTPVNIVPGLAAIILMMTMTLFTSVAIVRERERGNLELLINTPLTSAELMIGKITPYIAIGLVQLGIILAVGWLLFDVPLRGSLADLYLASLPFIAANLSLGLLISTAAATQFQAMQMTVFTMIPSILLSGFMFPFAGMPLAAQAIGEILPTTHFIRLTRGIVLRGASLGDLVPEILALTAFTLVAMSLAALRFKKRLD